MNYLILNDKKYLIYEFEIHQDVERQLYQYCHYSPFLIMKILPTDCNQEAELYRDLEDNREGELLTMLICNQKNDSYICSLNDYMISKIEKSYDMFSTSFKLELFYRNITWTKRLGFFKE